MSLALRDLLDRDKRSLVSLESEKKKERQHTHPRAAFGPHCPRAHHPGFVLRVRQRVGHQATIRKVEPHVSNRSAERRKSLPMRAHTHFFTASNGKLEIQNAFEASPPLRKLAVPGFISGEYRLNARWINSYERNLYAYRVLVRPHQFSDPRPGAHRLHGDAHGAHMTPEQQRRPEPVPQPLPPPDGDNLFRAIDRTRVQFRARHLHLQARLQVLGRAGDEAHGLAREQSRDLRAKSSRQ